MQTWRIWVNTLISYRAQTQFGSNFDENAHTDMEDEGHGQPFTITCETFPSYIFGAHFANLGQNPDELSRL